MCGCLSCTPQPGTWQATQACVLTGNQTGDPLVCRPALSPLSHTSQGYSQSFNYLKIRVALITVTRLGIILQKQRLPVPFPIRAHAWVAGPQTRHFGEATDGCFSPLQAPLEAMPEWVLKKGSWYSLSYKSAGRRKLPMEQPGTKECGICKSHTR